MIHWHRRFKGWGFTPYVQLIKMAAWNSWLLRRAQKTLMERHGFKVKHWTYSDVDYQLVSRIVFIKSMIRVASETMDLLAFPTILPSPSSKPIYPYTHWLYSQSAWHNVQTVTSNNCKQHLSGKPHLQYMICIYCIILYIWMRLKIGSKNAHRVWNCSHQNGIPAKWWVSSHIESYSSSTKWW